MKKNIESLLQWSSKRTHLSLFCFFSVLFQSSLSFAQQNGDESWQVALNSWFNDNIVGPIASVFFFDLAFWDNHLDGDQNFKAPVVVVWLLVGAVFFTLRFSFINFRGFKHAIAVVQGKFDQDDDPGEVSHFQALASALSATVGLGNIAMVAVAVAAGGPGAVFWMVLAGVLGMSSKFAECTLGQMYRQVNEAGKISGGPMHYLEKGIGELGFKKFGKALAVFFAIMCIGGSFGGGNMFQVNQSYLQFTNLVPLLDSGLGALVFGLVVASMVAIVIVGGIKRIGQVATWIVPIMCGTYLLAGVFVLIVHAEMVPAAIGQIVTEAFTPRAGFGGALGVLMTGIKRSVFSNEAGIGSASIAHSAAATNEPVREGIVALLEPFIDTVLVCSMTGIVLVITGAYAGSGEGIEMTSSAFESAIPWFPPVLGIAVFAFAYSTMISWSYYGERCWAYLFGDGYSRIYQLIFLSFIVLGAVLDVGAVIDFSSLMILGMAFPNILGVVILSPKIKARLDDYWSRLKSGEMHKS